MRPTARSRIPISAGLVLLCTLAAGCGASPSSPPAATAQVSSAPSGVPSPTTRASARPSPSASATVDAVGPFLATMGQGGFSANGAITGEIKDGALSAPVDGTLDWQGANRRQVVRVVLAGRPQVTESLTVDGTAYEHRGGLWFVKPDSGSSGDLATGMRSFLDLVDTGLETRDGESLHHLTSRNAAGVPASVIGLTDAGTTGKVTMDFYVRDDGTPVVISLHADWTDGSGATPVPASMSFDVRLTNVGGQVLIERPDQVWTPFASKKLGYSVAHPADWDVTAATKTGDPDVFFGPDDNGFQVFRAAAHGGTLNEFGAAYLHGLKKFPKASTTKSAMTVAGDRAWRIEWAATISGQRSWNLDAIVVRGGQAYLFEYTSLSKLDERDRALFDDFLSTVAFP